MRGDTFMNHRWGVFLCTAGVSFTCRCDCIANKEVISKFRVRVKAREIEEERVKVPWNSYLYRGIINSKPRYKFTKISPSRIYYVDII